MEATNKSPCIKGISRNKDPNNKGYIVHIHDSDDMPLTTVSLKDFVSMAKRDMQYRGVPYKALLAEYCTIRNGNGEEIYKKLIGEPLPSDAPPTKILNDFGITPKSHSSPKIEPIPEPGPEPDTLETKIHDTEPPTDASDDKNHSGGLNPVKNHIPSKYAGTYTPPTNKKPKTPYHAPVSASNGANKLGWRVPKALVLGAAASLLFFATMVSRYAGCSFKHHPAEIHLSNAAGIDEILNENFELAECLEATASNPQVYDSMYPGAISDNYNKLEDAIAVFETNNISLSESQAAKARVIRQRLDDIRSAYDLKGFGGYKNDS